MPAEGKRQVCLSWRNLVYQAGSKTILAGLNGYIKVGTLNALMGPSGAGKTTLLNALAGNRPDGLAKDSQIFFCQNNNGKSKIDTCFIQQHVQETIPGRMRVSEILSYAYKFKNGTLFGTSEMKSHIEDVLKQLLLDDKVLNRRFEQCSGGEQKRIAIAQELMSRRHPPQLLFIDEPTTGLDSNAALLVMQCLRQLTFEPVCLTVVTSIHSPSDEVLALFHRLYVLAKGGVAIYADRPENLRRTLTTQLQVDVPAQHPPIEVMLSMACNGTDDLVVAKMANITRLVQNREVSTRLIDMDCYPRGLPNTRKGFSPLDFLIMFIRYFNIIFIAEFHTSLIQLVASCFLMTSMVLILSADMVKPSGCERLDEVGNVTCRSMLESYTLSMQNIHYHGCTQILIGLIVTCTSAIFLAPMMNVFKNEYRNRWYSLGVFYWSTYLILLLQITTIAVVVALYSYFVSNQHLIDNGQVDWHRLLAYMYFLWLFMAHAQALGQMIGIALQNYLIVSIILGLILTTVLLMVNGYFFHWSADQAPLVKVVESIVGQKDIFHGMLWVFFGYKRCDKESEFSTVLATYEVEVEKVWPNTAQIFYNIAAMKLFTFFYIYFRRNPIKRLLYSRKSVEAEEEKLASLAPTPVSSSPQSVTPQSSTPPDRADNFLAVDIAYDFSRRRSSTSSFTSRERSIKEIEFENFSKGKVSLAWRHLSLFTRETVFEKAASAEGNHRDLILQNLNGYFRFGTLNALMGTSGAGKTTLLKVLNGRYSARLSKETEFYLSRYTKIETCFITQDVSGHLLPGLTARQLLIYASKLKNANVGQVVDHEKMALDLLEELNIADTVDTPVERCSGGERKRLALAAELTALHMPNVICIDEPTSGLDSNSAELVVSSLKELCHSHNITIITSVHQPSAEMLDMFDSIYVLARGGVAIYSGPPHGILSQLTKVLSVDTSGCHFPIELLIKHSCSAYPDPTIVELVEVANKRFQREAIDSRALERNTQSTTSGPQANYRRFSLEDWRNLATRHLYYIRGFYYPFLAGFFLLFLIYGLVMRGFFDSRIAAPSGCIDIYEDFNSTCSKQEINNTQDLKNAIQYVFFIYLIATLLSVIYTSAGFWWQLEYFINEHRNGWYSTGTFYLTHCLTDLIFFTVTLPFFVYLTDIFSEYRPGTFWKLLPIFLVNSIAAHGPGHFFAILQRQSIVLMAVFDLCFFLFGALLSNFFLPIAEMHYIFQMLSWVFVPRFGVAGIIVAVYGQGRCGEREVARFLYIYDLKNEDMALSFQVFAVQTLVYHLAAFVALRYVVNPVSNRSERVERIEDYQVKFRQSGKMANLVTSGCFAPPSEFRIKLVHFGNDDSNNNNNNLKDTT